MSKRNGYIGIRVTDKEREIIDALKRETGETMTDLFLGCVLKKAKRILKKTAIKE